MYTSVAPCTVMDATKGTSSELDGKVHPGRRALRGNNHILQGTAHVTDSPNSLSSLQLLANTPLAIPYLYYEDLKRKGVFGKVGEEEQGEEKESTIPEAYYLRPEPEGPEPTMEYIKDCNNNYYYLMCWDGEGCIVATLAWEALAVFGPTFDPSAAYESVATSDGGVALNDIHGNAQAVYFVAYFTSPWVECAALESNSSITTITKPPEPTNKGENHW